MALDKNRSGRYHFLRKLGYSAKEAKLWSHRSGERQIKNIDERFERATAKPFNERTERQNQLINETNRTRNERDRIILTKSDRVDNWREWSNKFGEGFPPDRMQEIIDINDSAGLSKFDKFGFRAYWFFYVEDEDDSDAIERAVKYNEDEGA